METAALVEYARPEVGLDALRGHLYDVVRFLGVTQSPHVKKTLLRVLQKLEMARLLDQHCVVAVTGLQGVGKTTLMREIYDIPTGILPEVTGRGEKLPVWIIEDPSVEGGIRAAVVAATIDPERQVPDFPEEPIDNHDVKRLTLDPEDEHLLLKLYVPPRFFRGSARSFLLLPGIEQDDTTPWVQLARHGLACSDAAIFVTNDAGWARATTEQELEQVRHLLEGRLPILALSFADQSPDGNAGLKATVMETLQISSDEARRVVATRTGDRQWVPDLRYALYTYARTERSTRIRQLRYLETLLEKEVYDAIEAAEQAADETRILLDTEEYQGVTRIIDTLEREIKSLRKDFVRALDAELEVYQSRAGAGVHHQIKRRLGGTFRGLRELAFGENGDDRRNLAKAVSAAWSAPDGDTLDRLLLRTLDQSAGPRFARYGALPHNGQDRRQLLKAFSIEGSEEPVQENADASANGRSALFETGPTQSPGALVLNDDVLRDLCILLYGSDEPTSEHLFDSVRALPAVALQSIRFGLIVPELFDLEAKTIAAKDQLKHVAGEFTELRNTGSGLFKGVGLMLGLDVLPDGEFDLVSDVFQKAGVSASVASPLAMGVVAAVAAAYGAVSVGSALNRMALDRENRAQVAIGDLRDRTRQKYIDVFDHMMHLLVEHVRDQLIRRYHLGDQFARAAQLQKALADARFVHRELDGRVNPLLLLHA